MLGFPFDGVLSLGNSSLADLRRYEHGKEGIYSINSDIFATNANPRTLWCEVVQLLWADILASRVGNGRQETG